VILLTSACTAASPSASPDPSASPPFSPSVEPDPSPPSGPIVDPNPSPPPSTSGPAWEEVGSLTKPQEWPLSDYHALLAGTGRVLVVGPKTAELWDQGANAWRGTTALNKPRYEFAAIALADGRVLVTGGVNEEPRGGGEQAQSFSSTYVYDARPGHEEWTKVGLLATARTAPSIARLPDGRVLVAGGYFYTGPTEGRVDAPGIELAAYHAGTTRAAPGSGPLYDVDVPPSGYALATAELFDPTTGTWTATGPMKYARAGAGAVTLADGRILVVGSSDANVTGIHADAYRTAEIYDPSTGRFSLAGRLPDIDLAAIGKLGVTLPDGDPAAGPNGELVALADGGALLIGHLGWWKHQAEIVRDLRFDGATASWVEVGQPHAWAYDEAHSSSQSTPGSGRVRAQVASLIDGRVLIAGGEDGYQYAGTTASTAELYEPTTDTWIDLPPMPEPRAQGGVVLLHDGSVLLVGGSGGWDQEGTATRPTSAVRFLPAR